MDDRGVLERPALLSESLDPPEDLPEQAPRQVAFGQLEDTVPRLPRVAVGERALVAGSIATIRGFLVALPYVVARGGPFALVKGVP